DVFELVRVWKVGEPSVNMAPVKSLIEQVGNSKSSSQLDFVRFQRRGFNLPSPPGHVVEARTLNHLPQSSQCSTAGVRSLWRELRNQLKYAVARSFVSEYM